MGVIRVKKKSENSVYSRLAVSTPWGIEFKENILLVVDDEFLVGVANDNGDGLILGLWDRLGLDTGLDLTADDALDEVTDGLEGDFLGLVEWIFVVVQGILDGEGGEFLWLKVKVGGVGAESLCVNSSKVDQALEFLGERLNGFGIFLTFLRGFGEDVGKGNTGLSSITLASYGSLNARKKEKEKTTYSHVAGVGLWANGADERGAGALDEAGDALSVEWTIMDLLALVKVLVQGNTRELNTLGLGQFSVVRTSEQEVIPELLSDSCVGVLGLLVVLSEVTDNNDLVKGLDFFEVFLCDYGYGGEGLFDHIRGDARINR